MLDRELATLGIEASQLPGYGTRATGHLEVAAAIAAGLADAGVASEPAALAYGLAFVSLTVEHLPGPLREHIATLAPAHARRP